MVLGGVLNSEMPVDFKKKGRVVGGQGAVEGRKMQGSKAFFSICSLAIPPENSRRRADDIMAYNGEISVIL